MALLNENGRINDSIKSDVTSEEDASLVSSLYLLIDIHFLSYKFKFKVTCGRCNKEMTFKEYRTDHCSAHYNLCWMVGEEKLVSRVKVDLILITKLRFLKILLYILFIYLGFGKL